MTEKTSYKPGTFSWIDLNAHDMQAAKTWYAELFGWNAVAQDTQGGPPYVQFQLRGKTVAGLGQMDDTMKQAGVPPQWNSYVTVEDANETAKKVEQAGGKVVSPVMKIMDAGSMAFFSDREGASFAVWQPDKHIGAELVNDVGCFCWNELLSHQPQQAAEFYGSVFGWEVETHKMGETSYGSITNRGDSNGGILEADAHMKAIPPHWTVYFTVENVDAAIKHIQTLGGKVHLPPTPIPEVGRFSVAADPQGATFCVLQMDNPG